MRGKKGKKEGKVLYSLEGDARREWETSWLERGRKGKRGERRRLTEGRSEGNEE